jgi:hypothetical protein
MGLVGISLLATSLPIISITVSAVLLLILFIYNLWNQPCVGPARYINHLRSASFGGLLWSSMMGMLVEVVSPGSSIPGKIAFCITPAVMATCWYMSRLHQRKLDISKVIVAISH